MNKEDIIRAIDSAFDNKVKGLMIDAEKHKKHHDFLDGLMKFTGTIRNQFWKSIINFIVYGTLLVLVVGAAVLGGKYFKGIGG